MAVSTWVRSRHLSSPAKPGPPPETPRRPAPPPPPKWRIWLLVAGTLLTLVLLFRPSTASGPKTEKLTYSDWVTQVTADKVKTVSMDQTGKVSGTLANGDH